MVLSSSPSFSFNEWHGSVTIHGRAVLSHRRPFVQRIQDKDGSWISKALPKSYLFDVNFYLHDSDGRSADSIVGVGAYFDKAGIDFTDEPGEFDIADISMQITLLSHQGLDEEVQSRLLPKEFDINQYSFVGTIHRMNWVGLVSEGHNVNCRPVLSIASIVESVSEQPSEDEEHTNVEIALKSTPYVKILKDLDETGRFHPSCKIIATYPKFFKKPVKPAVGGYVSIEALGTSVSKDAQGHVSAIRVEISTVTFQGRPAKPDVKPPPPSTPSPAAPGKRNASFNYADSPVPAKRSRIQRS
ncbi:hypothetical protein GGF50DRAFT_115604 [Schizophyllum commune]